MVSLRSAGNSQNFAVAFGRKGVVLPNEAKGERAIGVDRHPPGVAAGESRPQTGGRSMDSLRETVSFGAVLPGRLRTGLATAALWAFRAGSGDGTVPMAGIRAKLANARLPSRRMSLPAKPVLAHTGSTSI